MHKKNKNYWTFMFKYTNIELTVKRNKKQEGNKRMKGNCRTIWGTNCSDQCQSCRCIPDSERPWSQ